MENIYEIIIICFSDPTLDARTINLTRTLLKYDRSVCLITPDYGTEINYIENSAHIKCKINLDQKVRQSQKEFYKQIKKLKLNSKYIFASDYYSLKPSKRIKVKSGAKLIYDSREIYSKLNSLKDRPLAQKILEFKEKYLITYVDKIVVTAIEDKVYLKKHFMHNTKYHLIKNLPPKIDLKKTNMLNRTFNISNDKLILLYQGWILEGRGLDLLVESMKEIEDVELVIIGDGNYLPKLKNKIELFDIKYKVHLTGIIPYDELMEYTMSADVGVVLFENSSISYQNALPNKLFEFIQCGLPVITSDQKSMSEIVSSNNIGIVLNKYDKNCLIDSIEKMKNSKAREQYSKKILNIREKYSYGSQEVEILKVFS